METPRERTEFTLCDRSCVFLIFKMQTFKLLMFPEWLLSKALPKYLFLKPEEPSARLQYCTYVQYRRFVVAREQQCAASTSN